MKNIKQEFNFEKHPEIRSNICYGFLNKKKKGEKIFNIIDNNQKRWFFLISSRPLRDQEYDANDYTLESSALPYWIEFNTLYYFKYRNDEDDSEAKGKISLK